MGENALSFTNITFAAICWACSLIFGLVSLWAFRRKDPMHFWAGSTVMPEEISDIPAYNRANGLMWAAYAVSMAAAGLLSLLSIEAGSILLVVICIPGLVILIAAYNKIYKKYRVNAIVYKTSKPKSNVPRAVIVPMISITLIVFVAVAFLFFYGQKDPDVSILENQIQIKTMYGVDIDFIQIANIALIEKSMKDIGIGTRTNGFGGIGGALKGNFNSNTAGDTLLFVRSKSSPTIRIQRLAKKDVYISFLDSEDTEKLYRELKAAIQLK